MNRSFTAAIAVLSATVFASSAHAQRVSLPPAAPPPFTVLPPPAPPAPPPAPAPASPMLTTSSTLDVGHIAPDFGLPYADSLGPGSRSVTLSLLRGRVVVLAFYPGDRTSGCTAELTKFRDEYPKIFGKNTAVIAISVDSIASHASWAKEMRFPFVLASDTHLSVADLYGSHNPGRTFASRTVFVIGKDGRILWRNLKFSALNEAAYTELAAEVAKAQ